MDELNVSAARARLLEVLTGNAPGDVAALIDRVTAGLTAEQIVPVRGGWAWLLPQGTEGTMPLLAVAPHDVAAAVPEVLAAARERRWSTLMFSSYLGDEISAALIAALEPQLVATKMSIDVREVADTGEVELRPMSATRFNDYVDHGVEHYAKEIFAAGGFASVDDARAASRRQHDELLPDGLATKGHDLWSAYAPGSGDELGILWIANNEGWSFIYDIEVGADHRGRGHGTAMLRAGAAAVRNSGRTMLWLNVFGHNSNAQRLYQREGYSTNEQIWRVDTGWDEPA